MTVFALAIIGSCMLSNIEVENSDYKVVLVPGNSYKVHISIPNNGGARSLGVDNGYSSSITIKEVSDLSVNFELNLYKDGCLLDSTEYDVQYAEKINNNLTDLYTQDGLNNYKNDSLLVVFDRGEIRAEIGNIRDNMYRPEKEGLMADLIAVVSLDKWKGVYGTIEDPDPAFEVKHQEFPGDSDDENEESSAGIKGSEPPVPYN